MADVVKPPSSTSSRSGGSGGSLYIPSLDGLRAVAVMIVFVSHAGVHQVPGGFGVTVFFFLSGYLITTLLRRELSTTSRIDFTAFYQRRALRIFPPLYICLGLALFFAAIGFLPSAGTVRGVIAQALHFTNYWVLLDPLGSGTFPSGTIPYWSLAVEEHFYLIFPVVALVLMRRFPAYRQAQVLLGICVVVLAWRFALVHLLDSTTDRTYAATDTRIDAILYGCVMGLYRNPVLDERFETRRMTRWLIILASIAVILISMLYREPAYRETIRYTIQSVALAPIFYFAITHPHEGPMRLLNLAPVKFLGILSYTFYLNHLVYITGFTNTFPGWSPILTGVVSFLAILGTSLVIHYGVEQPLIAVRRRLRAAPVG